MAELHAEPMRLRQLPVVFHMPGQVPRRRHAIDQFDAESACRNCASCAS